MTLPLTITATKETRHAVGVDVGGTKIAAGVVTPDGICLDAEGAVWFADPTAHRAARVRPGGEVTDVIPFPEPGERRTAHEQGMDENRQPRRHPSLLERLGVTVPEKWPARRASGSR